MVSHDCNGMNYSTAFYIYIHIDRNVDHQQGTRFTTSVRFDSI
jgi:hypothetical protein